MKIRTALKISRPYFRALFCVAMVLAMQDAALAFDCAPVSCSKITTCAEARYKLVVCGQGDRDADRDGIPCEGLCGDDSATYEARALAHWPSSVPFAAGASKGQIIAPLIGNAHAEAVPQRVPLACEGKRTCKQMVSCEEAKFYLDQCGVAVLDGDHDGVPCNSLCSGR